MTLKRNIVGEYRLGDITLWLLFLRDIAETDYGEMYALCGKARRRKIDMIRPERKRKQSIGAGYLVFLLKERFSIAEEPVVLAGGKPVFREEQGVHFNLSHSGDVVVLAFGSRPLGVDAEYVKKADLKVAKRFFTEEEYAYLLARDPEERKDVFCRMWTGKEAAVKAAGGGLSLPLDGFSVLERFITVSGKRYELYRQRFTMEGEDFWISAAQFMHDSL